jgi:hypothetical protein
LSIWILLPALAIITRNLLVGLDNAERNTNMFWPLMLLTVPAVAPSAPLIQAQNENPVAGFALVPMKLKRLSPDPTVIVNDLDVLDGMDTPEKLVPPAFAKYADPAPGKGTEESSKVGAFESPFVDVRVYPFPLASA